MQEKIDDLMQIRNKELPAAQLLVERSINNVRKSIRFMIKIITGINRKERKLSVLRVLRDNVKLERATEKKLQRCMQVLRKFHTFWFFHKYRRIVHWEVQIKEKDSIQGAYLLLRRFKNRLKNFDNVVAQIQDSKVGIVEFDDLKRSLEKQRAMTIFEDMKLLFDTTVSDFSNRIQNNKDNCERLIQKLHHATNERILAQERSIENSFGIKLNRVERFVDNLVYDVAQIQSQNHTMLRESDIGYGLNTNSGKISPYLRSEKTDVDLNDVDTLFPPGQLSSDHISIKGNQTGLKAYKAGSNLSLTIQVNSIREMLEDIKEKQERTNQQVVNIYDNMSLVKEDDEGKSIGNSSKNIQINVQSPHIETLVPSMTPLYCKNQLMPKSAVNRSN